jgi:hypothetical protein
VKRTRLAHAQGVSVFRHSVGIIALLLVPMQAARGQALGSPAFPPSSAPALTDSEVQAAIGLGRSGEWPFAFMMPGDSLPLSAAGPIARIATATWAANRKHQAFTLDSVTPDLRSRLIVVRIWPRGMKVLGIAFRSFRGFPESSPTIEPIRVDTIQGPRTELRAYFNPVVLTLDALALTVTTEGRGRNILIGTERGKLR